MKKILKDLNKRLLLSVDKTFPPGLAQGQMGICIYFYHLSRIEQDEKYEVVAGQLLDDILEKVSTHSPINVEDGLGGICLGIIHLIKFGFVENSANELLNSIDNVIFRYLTFTDKYESNFKKEELLHLLFYLSIRLDDQAEENEKYIFQEAIIKTLNIFVDELTSVFFDEDYSFSVYSYSTPIFTYVLAKLLSQNFYNERIYKILEEYEPIILSRFPILHSNRLFLLCGILPLIPYMHNLQWKEYTDLLHREINIYTIFERELKNKHIFISNGLSMIYILFNYLEINYPEYKIAYNPMDIYNKIISSEAWLSLTNKDYFFSIHSGLLNGFPGVNLVLSHINKKRHEN